MFDLSLHSRPKVSGLGLDRESRSRTGSGIEQSWRFGRPDVIAPWGQKAEERRFRMLASFLAFTAFLALGIPKKKCHSRILLWKQ